MFRHYRACYDWPSSSHTAGAVRLGRVANKIMNQALPTEINRIIRLSPQDLQRSRY